jgi:LysM repeat protein
LRFNRPAKEDIIIKEKPRQTVNNSTISTNNNTKADTKDVSIAPKPIIKDTIVPIKKLPAIVPLEEVEKPIIEEKSTKETNLEKPILTLENFIKEVKNDSLYAYHIVQPGQTLYALARNYGTKVDSIKTWNLLTEPSVKVGQKLIVSKASGGLDKNFYWVEVKENNTLATIALENNCTEADIIYWNNKKDKKVFLGELLKIKKQ